VSFFSPFGRIFRRPPALELAEQPTPAQPDTQERGDTGQGYTVGGSVKNKALAKRLHSLERNWELYERRGYELYDRMRYSDPKVAGLLRAMRLPIISAEPRIEAAGEADPKTGKKDPRAVEIAKAVEGNLFDGLFGGWRANAYMWLLYLAHGFAPFEICWEIRDGKAWVDRLAYRPPATIRADDIYVLKGRIDHIQQTMVSGTAVDPISSEKLVWFVHEREGDDWCGHSLLRPMFKPWFGKEHLEVQLLIASDRGNGTPIATAPETGWPVDAETGVSQADEMDAALEAFCLSEKSYFNLPPGAKVEIMYPQVSVKELIDVKTSFDLDLTSVAIAEFRDLGKTSSGSYALSRTLADEFTDSLNGIATDLEDTLNAPEGLIHQMVDYNFAGADDYVPKLRFAPLAKMDLKVFALALYQLNQAGMPFGERDWAWIREELDMPERDDSQAGPKTGAGKASPPAEPAPADASQPQGGEPAPIAAAEHLDLADDYWRPLTPLECYANLAEIAQRIDEGPTTLRTATQATRNAMVAELVRRAQTAIATGDVTKVAALAQQKSPMVDKLAADIRGVYAEASTAGQQQVRDELARQKSGTPVATQVAQHANATTLAAPKSPRLRPASGETAPPTWYGDLPAYIDAQAAVTARQIASATQAAIAAEAMRALATKLSQEALIEMVTRASDAAALRAGLTVSHIMALGRADYALANRDQISVAFLSAILDDNTCQVCEDDDGTETTDLDYAASVINNPDCEGGGNCRCEWFFELKEGA
jgi:hypothetical protein